MKLNQLKAGAILSYLTLFLGSGVSILYTPVMLRLLGQSEYGLYCLSSSVIGYLGVLNFGLDSAIIHYTAKYRALGDRQKEYRLYGLFMIIYLLLGLLVGAVGAILVYNSELLFSRSLTFDELDRIKLIMALMAFNVAISFPFSIFESIILTYERFYFNKVLELSRVISNPVIMLPLLFLGYKSVAMTVAATLLNFVTIGINTYYCIKTLRVKMVFSNFEWRLLKEIAGYAFFVFLNIIVDKVFWSTNQFILGMLSGTVSVAIYTVALTFNLYYMSFSTAISGVFLPRVTAMVAQNASDSELSELFIKIGRIQYIIMAFIVSGFILFGQEFIVIWAGPEYNSAFYISIVIMIPLTIPLIQNLGISILYAKNMQAFRCLTYFGIAVVNIAGSIYLTPVWGGLGCAIASGAALLLGNGIIINIYYYKKVRLDIPGFWREIGSMTVPVVLAFIIGLCINTTILFNSMAALGGKIILFTSCYFSLMWVIGINKYEKDLFLEPVNGLLKTLKVVRAK